MATVLAYATLLHLRSRFPELLAIVADWLADRTSQHWTARRLLETATWKHPLMEVRTATVHDQERTRWALRLKTRDARVPGRDWLIELALGDREQGGVGATVIVQATDGHLHGLTVPAVPFSQPALVRALLERGAPGPDTPGLQPTRLDTEADARSLVARIADPGRTYSLLVLCRGEATLDVSALSAALIGMAECVELRPVLPQEVAAVLKPAAAWPSPARVALFPPRTSASSPGREQRLLLAAETRTLSAGVLKFGAPRVLAEHVTVERLQQADAKGSSDDSHA